jgi:hypothetical protein
VKSAPVPTPAPGKARKTPTRLRGKKAKAEAEEREATKAEDADTMERETAEDAGMGRDDERALLDDAAGFISIHASIASFPTVREVEVGRASPLSNREATSEDFARPESSMIF